MGHRPSRSRESRTDDADDTPDSTSTASEDRDHVQREASSVAPANRRTGAKSATSRGTVEGAPGSGDRPRSARSRIAYDPGPDHRALSDRYDLDIGAGAAGRLHRLEAEFGSERVSRWAEEGIPVAAMGKPRDMRAYRSRDDARPDETPTDTARRNVAALHRNAADGRTDGPAGETRVPDVVRRVISSPGRSMDDTVQREMEAKMGGAFDDVRVHTGPRAAAAADSIDARAFTVGSHVAFNEGEYRPDTDGGKRLLAHELTHVRQQTAGAVSLLPNATDTLAIDTEPALEREAQRAARRFRAGDTLTATSRPGEMHVQRQSRGSGGGSEPDPHHSLEDLPDPLGDEEAKQHVIDALEAQGLTPPEGLSWDDFLTVEGQSRGEQTDPDGGRETPEGWTRPERDGPATGLKKTVRVGLSADGTPITTDEWTEQIVQLAEHPDAAERDDLIPRFLVVEIHRLEGVRRGGEPTGPSHMINLQVRKAAPAAMHVVGGAHTSVEGGVEDLSPTVSDLIDQTTDEDFQLGQPSRDALADPSSSGGEAGPKSGDGDGTTGPDEPSVSGESSDTDTGTGGPGESPGTDASESTDGTSAAGPTESDTYEIQPGDTLWDIAREHDVEGGWRRLWKYKDNYDVIGENPHLIYPGDVIEIP